MQRVWLYLLMLKHDETSRQGARGPPTPSSESQQTRPNLPIRAHLSVRLPSSSRAPRLLPCKAGSPQTTLYFHPYVTVTSMCRVQQGPISPTGNSTRARTASLSSRCPRSPAQDDREESVRNSCLPSDHKALSIQTPCHQKGGF